MTTPEISYQEQARRGQDIYDAQIRGQLGAEDLDKFVMIDVLTRDYEIGLNRAETALRLLERRPRAVIHAIRRHRADRIRIGGGTIRRCSFRRNPEFSRKFTVPESGISGFRF